MTIHVNRAFREIAPAVFEAWLMTAPKQPQDQATVSLPILSGPVGRYDLPKLRQAIEALFFVCDVKTTQNIAVDLKQDELPSVPGIIVTCRSWDWWQEHREKYQQMGAA